MKTNNYLLVLILLGICFGCSTNKSIKEETSLKKPNVLVIMCDQLNAKALSAYDGPVSTPNIDRIANEGAKFTKAYATTPFCSPSRALFSDVLSLLVDILAED